MRQGAVATLSMLQRLPSPERIATLESNLAAVRARVYDACVASQRDPSEVCIVAVSKFMPASDILALYQLGHKHFGENYVQELVEKAKQLPSDIRWHFIGHLQSNKVKLLVQCPNLHLIESIDSLALATKLDRATPHVLPVLLQVNTSGEASKSGTADPAALYAAVRAECPRLDVQGVMTIGSGHVDAEFDTLRSLQVVPGGKLSMGMSGDFEAAIHCGSTHVRIGRGIFGERAAPVPRAEDG